LIPSQKINLSHIKLKVKNRLRNFPRTLTLVYSIYALFRPILRIGYSIYSLILLIIMVIQQRITGRRKVLSLADCTYFGDGFGTTHYVGFLHDIKFMNAYKNAFDKTPKYLAMQGNTLNIAWRAHIVTWAASQALSLEGDFVECGVWYGLLSKTICEYTDFAKQNKNFYLIDYWGGDTNPNASVMDSEYSRDIYEVVKERFINYPNVKLVRGLVPDVLDKVDVKKIAYLGIDMNGHIPERLTLERYYERVVTGGVIYFDDYGWEYPKLREVVEEFFLDKPESLLHFPSGNSIVVKL
jgi:O-methyltransferase